MWVFIGYIVCIIDYDIPLQPYQTREGQIIKINVEINIGLGLKSSRGWTMVAWIQAWKKKCRLVLFPVHATSAYKIYF